MTDDAKKLGPGDDVLTRDVSSGRIHRRIRIGVLFLDRYDGRSRERSVVRRMCAAWHRGLYHR